MKLWWSSLPVNPAKALVRRTPLGRNRERKAKLFAAQFGSAERVEAIKSLPCVVCGKVPTENAHLKSRATGGTWRDVTPLCVLHHRTGKFSLHNLGSVALFDATHGTRLWKTAERLAREIQP